MIEQVFAMRALALCGIGVRGEEHEAIVSRRKDKARNDERFLPHMLRRAGNALRQEPERIR